jgi:hypothetical protein
MACRLPTVVHWLNSGTESKNINIYQRPHAMELAAKKLCRFSLTYFHLFIHASIHPFHTVRQEHKLQLSDNKVPK